MARRTPAQIYADLVAAGFTPAAAVTMTEIALAESAGRVDALGDQSLQDATWGPSVGLYQIRTVKSETGTGSDRDILALQGDPARQAQAAFNISHRGQNFTPWSAFTNGAYQKFTQTVQDALRGIVDFGSDVASQAAGKVISAAQSAVAPLLSGARNIALTGLFVGLGVALLWLGAGRSLQPVRERTRAVAGKVAGVLA